MRFDHRRAADSGRRTAEDASGGRTSGRSGLAYACIEASGLLRLWEWRGTESGGWAWSYLDSCNICACREEPLGCRVLTAAIVQEPCGDDMGCEANASSSGKRRHRLVWEQEDSGEGAGLGLASTPSAGPRPPRRVWSRRMTLDLSEGGGLTGADATAGGRDSTTVGSSTARSEISLAFSACLLPTRVDALLCSRLGAWMPAGQRVYFNHFATGRLPCVTVPILLPPRERGKGWIESGAAAAAAAVAEVAADGSFGPDAGYEGAAGGTGDDGAPFPDESGLEVEGALDAGSKDPAGAEQAESFATEPGDGRGGGSASQASARRLFAVHDSTGDLMMYDRYPRPTLRVLSLPSGAGGLRVRQQCVLDPPPPAPPSPTFLPGSFAARSNVAVFCGGGLCSVYDLCTGRLVGSAVVPRCPACALRRRHRSNTTAGVAKPCTCGRRQHDGGAASEPHGGGRAVTAADAAGPGLWTSSTRGHMLGILTATQVLRVRVPTAEVCLAATLAPSLRGG